MTDGAGGAVAFGSFDAESRWRPPGLARLPEVRLGDSAAGMDQLLALACGRDDLLVTAAPASAAVVDALARAGLECSRVALPDGGGGADVEDRIAAAGTLAGRCTAGPVTRARPYSVQRSTGAALAHLGVRAALPALDAVVRVNSKTFSAGLVDDLGLPGAATVVRGVPELERAAAALGSRAFLVKDPYGVSGKGTLRVDSAATLASVARYLARQQRAGARVELLVQPVLDVADEFSAHFDVDRLGRRTGPVRFQQSLSSNFCYAGSGPLPPRLHDRILDGPYGAALDDLTRALAGAGYAGPVCVDGLRLADGSLVPVLEVNARLSMGRLNLALDERCRRDRHRSWLRVARLPPAEAGLVDRLLRELDSSGSLYAGDRPGVLVLAPATPAGRLFYAVVAGDLDTMRTLDARVPAAVRRAAEPAGRR